MIRLLFLLLISASIWATEPLIIQQKFLPKVSDKEALAHGARLYGEYCAGCHALRYLRYDPLVRQWHLPIQPAMLADDANQWFGTVPPDLSLVARYRSPDWLYHYLLGFYSDKLRPFGVNNLVFPNVAMPDVLVSLSGLPVLEGSIIN